MNEKPKILNLKKKIVLKVENLRNASVHLWLSELLGSVKAPFFLEHFRLGRLNFRQLYNLLAFPEVQAYPDDIEILLVVVVLMDHHHPHH